TPAPSTPSTSGNSWGRFPSKIPSPIFQSKGLTPAASIRTRISPAAGGGTWTSRSPTSPRNRRTAATRTVGQPERLHEPRRQKGLGAARLHEFHRMRSTEYGALVMLAAVWGLSYALYRVGSPTL